MHVGRMWCHCRMVYLPMSYLYGRRYVGPINSIIFSLRRELYTQPYHQINWDQARNLCAKVWLFFWKKENTWRIWYLLNLRGSNYSTILLLQLWCNGLWMVVYHLHMNLSFFLTTHNLPHYNCDEKIV